VQYIYESHIALLGITYTSLYKCSDQTPNIDINIYSLSTIRHVFM